jgi:hypothetical protein
MAIESAFRRVSTTPVEFAAAPTAWQKSNPRGPVSGPKSDRKARIKMTLAKRDGAKCAYCAREFVDLDDATLDHVIPNEVVGHWQEWNLLLACTACNNLKANKLPMVLMPLLCTMLRELGQLAQHRKQRFGLSKSARKKANRRARRRAANQKTFIRRQTEALAGHPIRLALEAPAPRAALLPGMGGA